MVKEIKVSKETIMHLDALKEKYAAQSYDEVVKTLIWKAVMQGEEIIL